LLLISLWFYAGE